MEILSDDAKEMEFYHSFWRGHWVVLLLVLLFLMGVVVSLSPGYLDLVLLFGTPPLALLIILYPGRAMIERKNGTPAIALGADRVVCTSRGRKQVFLFSELRRLSSYEIKARNRYGQETRMVAAVALLLTYREEVLPRKMAEISPREQRRVRRTERELGAHYLVHLDGLTKRDEYVASLVVDYYKNYELRIKN